jgi:hypothetical protein
MNYQFWIQQGTFQKHEAVSSGKKKHKVSNGTQHFETFRETVKHGDHQSTKVQLTVQWKSRICDTLEV